MAADIEKCKSGKHPLIKILSRNYGIIGSAIVRWCPICGAVVVDEDVDGRVYPGRVMKMRIPKYLEETLP